MRVCFSTLGCPEWTLDQAIAAAARWGYDGIELRFVVGDEALWARPELSGPGLAATRRRLHEAGLSIPCVASRVSFDATDPSSRAAAADEALRLVDVAAGLDVRGIRVFGNRIQPGATRDDTEAWIAEGIERVRAVAWPAGVEVWLESHGDFARSDDLARVLARISPDGTGAVWDPGNAFETGELPAVGADLLGGRIRHVHLKDLVRRPGHAARPALMGAGEFPAADVLPCLARLDADTWLCCEWEKRWHPNIAEPEIALPHFLAWLRAR